MSFGEYVKTRFAIWLEDIEYDWYELDRLDGLLLAMLIWAGVLYVLGLWQSDFAVAGLGGAGFVSTMIAMLVKEVIEDFHRWQRGEA